MIIKLTQFRACTSELQGITEVASCHLHMLIFLIREFSSCLAIIECQYCRLIQTLSPLTSMLLCEMQ